MPAAAGGNPPPPPPPPPPGPPPPPSVPPAPAAGGGGVAAVFAELNRGAEVTKNLRKVDKSEMTHKNPTLRASSTVPSTIGSSAGARRAFPSSDMAPDTLGFVVSTKETSQASETPGPHGQEARQICTRRQQVGHCTSFILIVIEFIPITLVVGVSRERGRVDR